MLQIFGYISAVLGIVMIIPYIRDMLLRRARPERGSWLIWTVLGSISFFSQMAKGATDSLWFTGAQTLAVLIIFIFSLKYGHGGLAKRDTKALIGAGVGLVLWYLTREASIALFIVILIDAIGVFLTAIKSYEDPGSETLTMWLMSSASGLFGAFAVGSFNPILLVYPLYIVVANLVIVAAVLLGRKRHSKKSFPR